MAGGSSPSDLADHAPGQRRPVYAAARWPLACRRWWVRCRGTTGSSTRRGTSRRRTGSLVWVVQADVAEVGRGTADRHRHHAPGPGRHAVRGQPGRARYPEAVRWLRAQGLTVRFTTNTDSIPSRARRPPGPARLPGLRGRAGHPIAIAAQLFAAAPAARALAVAPTGCASCWPAAGPGRASGPPTSGR